MRKFNRLSVKLIASLTKPGRYADGGNLFLHVAPGGAKRWAFIFRWEGRTVELGFGSARNVALARARELATQARAQIADGVRPIGIKAAAAAAAPAAVPTFGEVVDQLIASMESGWKNDKHRAQWKSTMATYAKPLRSKPVNDITTADVLAVLQPIWNAKPETASRVRGRIERALDAAKAKGLRSGENPARWRGHLDQLLPARRRLTRGHHAAMAYADLPAFMVDLREREAVAARALEFVVLTAARSGEALGATWPEIDFARAVWTVPGERMKAGREHRVPLSAPTVAILTALHEVRGSDREYIFPGPRGGQLSGMAMAMLIKRMGVAGAPTVHGFRSTFRDWSGEATTFANEVCEMALAHVVANKAEAAYRRGDMLERRRELMSAWAGYCNAPGANVVPFDPRALRSTGG